MCLCSGIGLLGCGELREGHLLAGDLSGGGVDEKPFHEHLWGGVAGCSELGVVVGLEVVLVADGVPGGTYGHGLAVGSGHSVGLGCAGHDDEPEVGHVLGGLGVEGEGELVCGERDGGSGGCLHSPECRRVGKRVSSAGDDPVVEPHVEVAAGDLGRGTEDGASCLGLCEAGPCQYLLVGEGLPTL